MQCHQEEAEIVILAHSHCKGGEKKECKKLQLHGKTTIIEAASTAIHPSIHRVWVGAHFVN